MRQLGIDRPSNAGPHELDADSDVEVGAVVEGNSNKITE